MRSILTLFILLIGMFSNIFADENAVYFIRNIEFDIQGKTKPFALLIVADMAVGEEIIGDGRLAAYIGEKEQAILNKRQIENAVIEFIAGEADETGRRPVDLVVKTVDTNNFIILPYPKFSSSSGTKLELRLRDFNFLGSLSEFGINLGYMRDADGNNYANAVLKFDLPFQYFGLDWNFGFNNEFSYRFDNSDVPFYFNNISSLSVAIPVYRTTLTLGFEQNLTLEKEELFDYDSEKSPFTYLVSDAADVIDFHNNLESYFTSEPFAAWKIPLGIQFFSFGELAYEPTGGVMFRYWPFDGREQYCGPIGVFAHSIGFSRINWRGNFQSGFSFNAEQNNHFYFDGKQKNMHDVSVTGIGHIPLADFFGASFRIRYQHTLFTETHYLAVGGPLRGIPDKSLTEPEKNLSTAGLAFVNLDLPFRIGLFRPSEWGTGKRATLFDLEFHLAPFFDAAFLEKQNGNNYEWLVTGGLELKIFPLAFRSFFIRVSAGFDLQNSDNYEIFIGLGNHY
jgi:outer membrane protein assembly factor BamA